MKKLVCVTLIILSNSWLQAADRANRKQVATAFVDQQLRVIPAPEQLIFAPIEVNYERFEEIVKKSVQKKSAQKKNDCFGVQKPKKPVQSRKPVQTRVSARTYSLKEYKEPAETYEKLLVHASNADVIAELHNRIEKDEVRMVLCILEKREDLRTGNTSLGARLWKVLFKEIIAKQKFLEGLDLATLPKNTLLMAESFAYFGKNRAFLESKYEYEETNLTIDYIDQFLSN